METHRLFAADAELAFRSERVGADAELAFRSERVGADAELAFRSEQDQELK